MIGSAVVLVIIVLRLIDLQVVRADHYRRRAEEALLRPAKTLPFVRGRLLDRFGQTLAADEPCWQVSVDYDILSGSAANGDPQKLDAIEAMWADLAIFGDQSVGDLLDRADRIVQRVDRWRRKVSDRFGYSVPIREERMAHPILTGLDDQEQIAAREYLAVYPWVTVEHGSRRLYHPDPSLGHLLGQLGSVGPDDLRDDPHAHDPAARYRATDTKGISGVEYAAEQTLRGRRGRLRHNRSHEVVEHVPAVDGRDVALTLRIDLQETLYQLLDDRISELCPDTAAGGAIVVLHVPTREVLALVSYPGFDANQFRTQYERLRADTRYTPLRFRALANTYEPGSIVKPLTCLAGLGSKVITTETTFNCTGYYLEGVHDRLRCWPVAGTSRRRAHGDVAVSDALCGSCNIFMYHVADLVGVGQLTSYFDMAGFGRSAGIGLPEERQGINPTPSWLMQYRNAPATAGRAKNFAIGQGELSITPLQAANLVALYASGVWKPVTLIRNPSPRPAWNLPVKPAAWSAVRQGLYRVTNDPVGTAYYVARWTNGRYALCGKTGSATTPPSPTQYRIDYLDTEDRPQFAVIPAKVRKHAIEDFRRQNPDARFDPRKDVTIDAYWPPKPDDPNENYAHAWFVGYLQPIAADGHPLLDKTPPIAFAVLVEFGSSGGHTTGPIARDIARIICDTLGDDLNPDALVEEPLG